MPHAAQPCPPQVGQPPHDREPPPDPVLLRLAERAGGRAGSENFPVALRLVPRVARDELMRVYRYARFVDNIGDESPGDPAARTFWLDTVAADVRAAAHGRARLPVVRALTPLLDRVPLAPFVDLIEANRRDQTVRSYATFDELLDYCRLSARPVGEIVLHLADAATEANLADSAAVCAALQVLEHCQDVAEDARAGRVYLPADSLAAAGVHPADLVAATTGPALRRVLAEQTARAEHLLHRGAPLVARLHGWSRYAVTGYVAGGRATAAALRRAGYGVLEAQVRPSRLRTAGSATTLLATAPLRRSRR